MNIETFTCEYLLKEIFRLRTFKIWFRHLSYCLHVAILFVTQYFYAIVLHDMIYTCYNIVMLTLIYSCTGLPCANCCFLFFDCLKTIPYDYR